MRIEYKIPTSALHFLTRSEDIVRTTHITIMKALNQKIKSFWDNKMLIMVNHERKVVIPCDLKTSSHREYDFYKSFVQWNYQIQSRLYWRLIRQAMDNDGYFRDFRLADYRFIVVNSIDNPNPLVWRFEHTQDTGDIKLGKHILRDPEEIGKELWHYLQEKPAVPEGIDNQGVNSISEWLMRER